MNNEWSSIWTNEYFNTSDFFESSSIYFDDQDVFHNKQLKYQF